MRLQSRRLGSRHQLAVPFENLSIHLNKPISLDEVILPGSQSPQEVALASVEARSRARGRPAEPASWRYVLAPARCL